MENYGIPYMGSKSQICEAIISLIPKANHFYDLFGGGFSITHAMLVKRPTHFKEFHFNELRPGMTNFIQDCIAGKYSYKNFTPKFVSRQEFFLKKETDPYIKMCWSFGNNGADYIFSKEIEPYKRSMHNAIVFNEFDELAEKVLGMKRFSDGYGITEKRLFLRNKIEYFRKNKIFDFLKPFLNEKRLQQLERLERLQQLEQLQQLQQLQQLERLQRLHFYNDSYENIPIKENSVIYCDPPYIGTAEYDNPFDHRKFYDWADSLKHPVFISEYRMPNDRFFEVFSKNKISLLCATDKGKVKKEKLFVNKCGFEYLRKRI